MKLKAYHWHGMEFELPAALKLAKWCSLEDKVLEFRASDRLHKEGFELLKSANVNLTYDIVDGALWVQLASSMYDDLLPGPLATQLVLWEKRSGMKGKYIVSGSSGILYNSNFPKMLIPNCAIFDTELLIASKERDARKKRDVPRDLRAEIVFEFVSVTDNIKSTWERCKQFVASDRAKMAVGICDRFNTKEVCAAGNGNKDMVEFMLDNGGHVDFQDVNGVCPLLAAIAEERREIISLLRKKGGSIDLSIDGLKGAVDRNQLQRLRLLLKGGANINEVDTGGLTILMHAVLGRKVDVVNALVCQGASLTLLNPRGLSALNFADMIGDQEIIRVLQRK